MSDRIAAINFHNHAAQIPPPPPVNANIQLKYQLFASSVVADPTMGQGLYELAKSNQDMGLLPAAVALYRQIIALPDGNDPGDTTPYIRSMSLANMAHALHVMGKNDEAEVAVDAALQINDNLAMAWATKSMIDSINDRLPSSLKCARNAHALEPESAPIEVQLAFAHLYNGDFATGLKHFEARFPYKLTHFLQYPYPKWRGEEGKTVYLVSEQGLGDMLSFSRFIEQAAARCKFMHIIVQKELARLLRVALQHIQNIGIMAMPQPFLSADYWTTPMSLPFALGLSNEEIINVPHIRCPQFMTNAAAWKNYDAKFHIGVAWSGSPGSDINHWRSFPVTMLLDLYKVPNIQLYSIQTNDQAKQLHDAGCATLIRDLAPHISDVADTIAIMDHLDLVITTESAPGHIAALAGVECWIPYSRWGRDWRLGPTGDTRLWTPKHRVFRQDESATWQGVFDRMVEALKEKLGYG